MCVHTTTGMRTNAGTCDQDHLQMRSDIRSLKRILDTFTPVANMLVFVTEFPIMVVNERCERGLSFALLSKTPLI